MSNDAPQLSWAHFEAAWRAVADLVVEIAPDAGTRDTVLHAVDDSDFAAALVFAAASVHHSDGREPALRLAELVLPLIVTMRDDPDAEAFESSTFDPAERLAVYESVGRRLRSVVDAHEAGRAVPPAFRSAVETWWDGLVADDGLDVDAAIAQAQARLDSPLGGDEERFWLHEILIDWLYVDDQWRWQPALVLLARDGVERAVGEMRSAALYSYNEKAAFADTFRRYADQLEAATESGAT